MLRLRNMGHAHYAARLHKWGGGNGSPGAARQEAAESLWGAWVKAGQSAGLSPVCLGAPAVAEGARGLDPHVLEDAANGVGRSHLEVAIPDDLAGAPATGTHGRGCCRRALAANPCIRLSAHETLLDLDPHARLRRSTFNVSGQSRTPHRRRTEFKSQRGDHSNVRPGSEGTTVCETPLCPLGVRSWSRTGSRPSEHAELGARANRYDRTNSRPKLAEFWAPLRDSPSSEPGDGSDPAVLGGADGRRRPPRPPAMPPTSHTPCGPKEARRVAWTLIPRSPQEMGENRSATLFEAECEGLGPDSLTELSRHRRLPNPSRVWPNPKP